MVSRATVARPWSPSSSLPWLALWLPEWLPANSWRREILWLPRRTEDPGSRVSGTHLYSPLDDLHRGPPSTFHG